MLSKVVRRKDDKIILHFTLHDLYSASPVLLLKVATQHAAAAWMLVNPPIREIVHVSVPESNLVHPCNGQDYDCFYASVIEAETPSLKSLPLAVQQKQIVVTCNYEARRRGLYKLQLITDAKRICPDVVIVLGEDLTRFRDASKQLYNFLRSYSWSDKVERLGFDEVWMDVTDTISYNVGLLNVQDLQHSFFHLSREDPTIGFEFDASKIAGNAYPQSTDTGLALGSGADQNFLLLRLMLGSHLALFLRHQLEEQKEYTCTVGISTSKLLSKLIGSRNKPKGQTTLLPPYESNSGISNASSSNNVLDLLDGLDVGSIPGIGFKLARKLRELVLGRPGEIQQGLVYGAPKEKVTVGRLRQVPNLSPKLLDKELSAPGTPHDVGLKVYSLLHGVDDSEVIAARNVPKQISLEDSYVRLDTMEQAIEQLRSLSRRLLERMRIDLTESDGGSAAIIGGGDHEFTWLARPTTARLSTRPRLPLREDGTRARSFKRISRSSALPSFVFALDVQSTELAERMVTEVWLPLFKKLHPESRGWNLSLMNIAVTGMEEQQSLGADISSMFRKQQRAPLTSDQGNFSGNEHAHDDDDDDETVGDSDDSWAEDGELTDNAKDLNQGFLCERCGYNVPLFAQVAHQRFHDLGHV